MKEVENSLLGTANILEETSSKNRMPVLNTGQISFPRGQIVHVVKEKAKNNLNLAPIICSGGAKEIDKTNRAGGAVQSCNIAVS